MSSATANPELRLSWDDPVTGEDRIWSGQPPVSIGRADDNTIVLNGAQVSRYHARLEWEGGALVLTDQGSSNGTYVNGGRVSRATLEDGATFTVGPFTLLVDLNGVLTAAAPAGAAALRLRWQDPAGGGEREAPVESGTTLGRGGDNRIVLPQGSVSRRHAVIALEGGEAVLIDQGSGNGTFVNGRRVQRATIGAGDRLALGDVQLAVEAQPQPLPAPGPEAGATQIVSTAAARSAGDRSTVFLDIPADLASLGRAPSWPPPFFREGVVPIAALASAGLPVEETTYLAVGGGLGSFVWVDHLAVYGADPRGIVAIGLEEKPYGRYARLCRQSQIPDHERLRSNSDSCPDNIWGWPGYAVREVGSSLVHGDFGNAAKRTWQIFGEPTLAETYTPRAGDVFRSIDREAARIGWPRIWRFGRVRAIRCTDDGRYVVAYSQSAPQQPGLHRLILARYVHVAVGYPGIRLLPDLQEYRERTGDFETVVNAYEDHEQVYQHLLKHGGVALVRGRGIVASRIIQRLNELRARNPRIGILHLMRSPVAKGHRYERAEREVQNHWEFQPFNWPKATWGGELRFELERADDGRRDLLLNEWGGTTTARRS
ncbi:MAG: FHA domain-containing protein, partial [Chloroflexota bacterium]|nr:FHA domain-containing protein [Chloroflexota bacterium]